MQRLFLFTICLFYSCLGLTETSYQIDLILFAHPYSDEKTNVQDLNLTFTPINSNAITLNTDLTSPRNTYQLLKTTNSDLMKEYYSLNYKSPYQILAHYSWKQPQNNQKAVALPTINHKGWKIDGTVRVRQSNYYLFDATLQCSPSDDPNSSFTLSQKQRLKNGVVYYLDHAQVGMLIKVHK